VRRLLKRRFVHGFRAKTKKREKYVLKNPTRRKEFLFVRLLVNQSVGQKASFGKNYQENFGDLGLSPRPLFGAFYKKHLEIIVCCKVGEKSN